MSLNHTWPSIGHVAGVSLCPAEWDNQAACFAIDRHGDRSAPGGGHWYPPPPQLPHRVGVSVRLGSLDSERPLTASGLSLWVPPPLTL